MTKRKKTVIEVYVTEVHDVKDIINAFNCIQGVSAFVDSRNNAFVPVQVTIEIDPEIVKDNN